MSEISLQTASAREDISHARRCPQQKMRLRGAIATMPPAKQRCYARRVETQDEAQQERARAGLCSDCVHARRIESDRGAKFYLCELSAVDPAYRKYPALPVMRCAGYQAKA
jgi:hypothetical protein